MNKLEKSTRAMIEMSRRRTKEYGNGNYKDAGDYNKLLIRIAKETAKKYKVTYQELLSPYVPIGEYFTYATHLDGTPIKENISCKWDKNGEIIIITK